MRLSRKSYTIKTRELVFFACYTLYLLYTILGASFFVRYYISFYNYGIAVILLPLIILELSYGKIRKKSIWIIPIAILMLLIIIRVSDMGKIANIVALFAFIYVARNIEFTKIAKVTIAVELFALIFVILSSKIGIIENYITYSFGRRREFLGFLYALTPSSIFANIVFLEVYTKKEKLSFLKAALYALAAFYLFITTDSRLSFVITLVALAINLLTKILGDSFLIHTKLAQVFMCLSYPLCAGVSIYLATSYNETGWRLILNNLLNSRLQLAQNAINEYGLSLFGNEIEWSGWGLKSNGQISNLQYNYVDNSYIQMLVQYGIVLLFLFILLFFIMQVFLCRNKNFYLAMIFSIIAFRGLIEDSILSLVYNTFWFAFAQLLSIKQMSIVDKTFDAIKSERRKNRKRVFS